MIDVSGPKTGGPVLDLVLVEVVLDACSQMWPESDGERAKRSKQAGIKLPTAAPLQLAPSLLSMKRVSASKAPWDEQQQLTYPDYGGIAWLAERAWNWIYR